MDETQDNPQFASLGDDKARLILSIEFEHPVAAPKTDALWYFFRHNR